MSNHYTAAADKVSQVVPVEFQPSKDQMTKLLSKNSNKLGGSKGQFEGGSRDAGGSINPDESKESDPKTPALIASVATISAKPTLQEILAWEA